MSSQDEGKYKCVDCGRTYKAAETLNRHRKNHVGVPNHVCSVCSAGFRRNDLLQRHMRIHQRQLSRSASPESQLRNNAETSSNRILNRMSGVQWDLSLGADSWRGSAHDADSLQRQTWDMSGVGSPPQVDVAMNNLVADDPFSNQFDPLSWAIETSFQFGNETNDMGADIPFSKRLTGVLMPSLDQPAISSANDDSLIFDLVEYAMTFQRPASDEGLRRLAVRVENQLGFHGLLDASKPTHHLLDRCVELFFKHFHLLWPFLRETDLRNGECPNYLYMVASGIGLIYLGQDASMLYAQLLGALRERLTMLVYSQKVPEESLMSVCQALLLTQMGIWTFRGEDHVETAELTGSTVVYFARRLNLFNSSSGDLTALRTWITESPSEVAQKWIMSEERKRLAFGIYRTQLCVAIATGRSMSQQPLPELEKLDT